MQTSTEYKPTRRNEVIDLLRGIATLMVVVLHFQLSYDVSFIFGDLGGFLQHGNYGVTMFFVISGYLITSNSMRRYSNLNQINIKEFYLTRVARIIPPLCLALIVICFLAKLELNSFTNSVYREGIETPSIWLTIFSVLSFWHNAMMDHYGYFNYAANIYWSLSVEEMFYLVFPIFCIVAKKKSHLVVVLATVILIAPTYRFLNSHDDIKYMYGYFACFDALSMGILTAHANHCFQKENVKVLLRYCGILMLTFTYFILGIHNHQTLGFTLIAFGTSLIIVTSTHTVLKMNIFSKLLTRFGRNSYEVYLFHIIVLGLIRHFIPPKSLTGIPALALFLCFVLMSGCVAQLIAKYYSEPTNLYLRSKYRSITTTSIAAR